MSCLKIIREMRGRALNDCTNDDTQSTNEHATTTAKAINSRPNEWDSDDRSDLIHRRDQTSPDTTIRAMEEVLEDWVEEELIQKTSIVAVGCRAEESDACQFRPWVRFLLNGLTRSSRRSRGEDCEEPMFEQAPSAGLR